MFCLSLLGQIYNMEWKLPESNPKRNSFIFNQFSYLRAPSPHRSPTLRFELLAPPSLGSLGSYHPGCSDDRPSKEPGKFQFEPFQFCHETNLILQGRQPGLDFNLATRIEWSKHSDWNLWSLDWTFSLKSCPHSESTPSSQYLSDRGNLAMTVIIFIIIIIVFVITWSAYSINPSLVTFASWRLANLACNIYKLLKSQFINYWNYILYIIRF